MKDFNNKIAVVTGAGSGIGQALALELTAAGAQISISDWDAAGLKETSLLCARVGSTPHSQTLDVRDRAAVHAYADAAATHFGTVNLVINNATGSNGLDTSGIQWLFDKHLTRVTPEQAAHAILRAVKASRAKVLIGADAHAVDLLVRALGSAYRRPFAVASKRLTGSLKVPAKVVTTPAPKKVNARPPRPSSATR